MYRTIICNFCCQDQLITTKANKLLVAIVEQRNLIKNTFFWTWIHGMLHSTSLMKPPFSYQDTLAGHSQHFEVVCSIKKKMLSTPKIKNKLYTVTY